MCGLIIAQDFSGLKKVREIKILESNREDVHKIFTGYESHKTDGLGYRESFNTNAGEFEFVYSDGRCVDEVSDGFDVSEWKVEFIELSLKDTLKLKDIDIILKIFGGKLADYRKEGMFINDDNLYMYHNKDSGIGIKVNKENIEEIIIVPQPKYYSLTCDKKIGKRLSSTKSFFTSPLKERRLSIFEPASTDVSSLILSPTQVITDCHLSDNAGLFCLNKVKIIDVRTSSNDPKSDNALTFDYKVTGGKIIGRGAKVQWDLSDVKAGTYAITAAVDDGCGFCGKSLTKTVVVKECLDCPPKE